MQEFINNVNTLRRNFTQRIGRNSFRNAVQLSSLIYLFFRFPFSYHFLSINNEINYWWYEGLNFDQFRKLRLAYILIPKIIFDLDVNIIEIYFHIKIYFWSLHKEKLIFLYIFLKVMCKSYKRYAHNACFYISLFHGK